MNILLNMVVLQLINMIVLQRIVDNSLTISARYQVYFWREERLHMKMSAYWMTKG